MQRSVQLQQDICVINETGSGGKLRLCVCWG
jgi:hypothetical protein